MGRTSEKSFLLKIPVGLRIIFFLKGELVYNVITVKIEYGKRRKIKVKPVGDANHLVLINLVILKNIWNLGSHWSFNQFSNPC